MARQPLKDAEIIGWRLGGGALGGASGLRTGLRWAGPQYSGGSSSSMFAGTAAARGLLQLPLPLLLLPQVGRRALGSGPAGLVCPLCVPARTHPCTHRWRWDSRTAAATPPTSKSGAGGEGAWRRPARRRGRGSGPDRCPACSRCRPVPADAHPRRVGAACGTWGKWRPRRRAGAGSNGSPWNQAHQILPLPPLSPTVPWPCCTAEESPALSPAPREGAGVLSSLRARQQERSPLWVLTQPRTAPAPGSWQGLPPEVPGRPPLPLPLS